MCKLVTTDWTGTNLQGARLCASDEPMVVGYVGAPIWVDCDPDEDWADWRISGINGIRGHPRSMPAAAEGEQPPGLAHRPPPRILDAGADVVASGRRGGVS